MSTEGDDLDAQIDAWTQEQLAASPGWSMEKWSSVMAILELDDPRQPDLVTGEQEMTCPPVALVSF
ncbi:hypothetical protein VT50_0234710 [Streptomyces antioxidans]|uniref:Uncharacterized protein n=1 Tax=Streptomyces antioxidans TaxID=1507734 RepID=A0A1V4CVF2_9ACTN|nr:hypothetical protein [Streptomyces antioxidans]OPF71178.1 hypothetical protein VT50_0234710 [Streptomyces antioxidans]